MKKKLILLLAGAMTLSVLLSACSSAAEDSSPDAADTPAASALTEPTAPPESKEPAMVSTPSEAPESAEPSQAVVVQTAEPTQTPAVADTPAPNTQTPAVDTPQPASAQPAATKEAAEGYIGQNVSNLIAAIGQPNSRSYAPSCMGDGEDGELTYNGFTVYTYREDGVETVEDVL